MSGKSRARIPNTWSNGFGNTLPSNDPNVNPHANPNGVAPGNWTRDQRVHGDGQPY